MAQLATLAMNLSAASLPVLMLDTCSSVDVASGPARMETGSLSAAVETIVAATDAVPRCSLVAASLIGIEFGKNLTAGVGALTSQVDSTNRNAKRLEEACHAVGVAYARSEVPDQLATNLEALARAAHASASVIDQEERFVMRAQNRVVMEKPPSRKGSFKDSQIIEEYLELARLLKAGAYAPAVVFLTSNVNDFCREGYLHPDLKQEFDSANRKFAKDWQHAKHSLVI